MTAAFAEPFTGTDHDDFAMWAREVRPQAERQIALRLSTPTTWLTSIIFVRSRK